MFTIQSFFSRFYDISESDDEYSTLGNLNSKSITIVISTVDNLRFEIKRFILMSLSPYFKNIFSINPAIPSLILPRIFSLSILIGLRVLLAGNEVRVPVVNRTRLHSQLRYVGISVKKFENDLEVERNVPTIIWRKVDWFFQYIMYRPKKHRKHYKDLDPLPFDGVHDEKDSDCLATEECSLVYSIGSEYAEDETKKINLITRSGFSLKLEKDKIKNWSPSLASALNTVPNIKYLMVEPEIGDNSLIIFARLLDDESVTIGTKSFRYFRDQLKWFDCDLEMTNKQLDQRSVQILANQGKNYLELIMNQDYIQVNKKNAGRSLVNALVTDTK